MYHYIYKVTSKSGKYYIGRHSTKNLEDNYIGSGKWIRSLKDRTQLTKEIIEFCDSFDALKEREKFYITEHIDNPLCMNFNNESIGFASGDLNPARNEIERKRRSERAISNNPSKNIEVAKKISDSLRGRPNPRKGIPRSPETCRKISDGRKGIKYSEEGKKKLSQSRSRDYHSGKRKMPSFSGRSHSDETKSKQSQSALNRKRVKCPYCDKEGAVNTMTRWHFDNCKSKGTK